MKTKKRVKKVKNMSANEIRYRNMKVGLIALVLLAVGLFFGDNVVENLFNKNTVIQYYRAVKDIPPFTELTPSLFSPVKVEAKNMPDGMIYNFSEVQGSFAKGPIYKGEYLSAADVTTKNDEKNYQYMMEIKADYSGPLEFDKYVDVYTLSKDNVPSALFTNKRLYQAPSAKQLSSDAESGGENVDKKYIKVTKQEMLEYYSKLKTYTFIVLPIETAYTGTSAGEIGDISENTDKEEDLNKEEVATFSWDVKEGETWDSLANDWSTTPDKLKELNKDVKEVKAGIKIKIPESN
ncbi:MAG: SAF domain-containing protein [Erysipelotrichaceae bacterium]